MGLDGCVFLRPENLTLSEDVKLHMTREPETGDYIVEEGWDRKAPYDLLVASDEHIGNIATVGYLNHTLAEHCAKDAPILLKKVLYSGTHCGDFIPRDEVNDLSYEVKHALAVMEQLHQEGIDIDIEVVRYSLGAVGRLCEAAIAQNNPIVF